MSIAAERLEVHLLDVGTSRYGDAILCVVGGQSILIDGGHANNSKAVTEQTETTEFLHPSIQDQVQTLLGASHIDLLVVTHCHSDHVGCLPELVESGKLTFDWALMAHPSLGFGLSHDDPAQVTADRMTHSEALLAAFREELYTSASDGELVEAISDAARLYESYGRMLRTLDNLLGKKMVLFGGADPSESPGLERLLEFFAPARLTIHGPMQAQLLYCSEFLRHARSAAVVAISDAILGRPEHADATNLATTYRELVELLGEAVDSPIFHQGAAVNCQSIVLSVGTRQVRALLTGDMQFAAPELGAQVGLEMERMIRAIGSTGKFDFIKLPHHGSVNGVSETIIDLLGGTHFGISTGSHSASHPSLDIVKLLERKKTSWVRTDRNGLCGFKFVDGQQRMTKTRGAINDSTVPYTNSGLVRWPARRTVKGMMWGDRVRTEPTMTNRLLFVTDPMALQENIGIDGMHAVFAEIKSRGKLLTADGAVLLPRTRDEIRRGDVDGVVLIGGYDVVPSRVLDALPPSLRAKVKDSDLGDNYYVWSDDGYGDWDLDGVPEVAVSRIPDGRDQDLLLSVLRSQTPYVGRRGGIRNRNREYADDIFTCVPGNGELLRSLPLLHDQTPPYDLSSNALYLVLHGLHEDASVFYGEPSDFAAMTTANVPDPSPGLIFTACCWGGLIVESRASRARSKLAGRTARESIALRFLSNGANAFIGCTGAHYSPPAQPYDSMGAPFHRAFWWYWAGGESPARALLKAKYLYAQGIDSRHPKSCRGRAIEHKILCQYTCLGLGW